MIREKGAETLYSIAVDSEPRCLIESQLGAVLVSADDVSEKLGKGIKESCANELVIGVELESFSQILHCFLNPRCSDQFFSSP